LEALRALAISALGSAEDEAFASECRLKRLLRVLANTEESASPIMRQIFNVPAELLNWIDSVSSRKTLTIIQSKTIKLVKSKTLKLLQFLADEAKPAHALEATKLWMESSDTDLRLNSLPIIHTALGRAASNSEGELSRSILRMKHAQNRLVQNSVPLSTEGQVGSIWARMSSGTITMNK
jgi:hypothetical protein